MDFIYVSKDSDKNVFKEYAKSKNFIIRDEIHNETWVAYLKPKPDGYESYPSIDTMRYWDRNSGKLSNKSFTGSSEIYWDNDGDGDDEQWEEDDDY